MSDMKINAGVRSVQGTGASRRLRRSGKVPGVLYGGKGDAKMIELDHKETLMQLRQEAFHSSILDMALEGKSEKVLLRDVQMHPWKAEVLHIDFQRVSAKEKITMRVPLHFINEDIAPGVKLEGGLVQRMENEVEVSCLPADLPEYIEVNLEKLALGESIHLTDLGIPDKVELVHLIKGGEDLGLVSIQKARVSAADEGAPKVEGEGEDGAGEGEESSAEGTADSGGDKKDDSEEK